MATTPTQLRMVIKTRKIEWDNLSRQKFACKECDVSQWRMKAGRVQKRKCTICGPAFISHMVSLPH